MITQVLESSAVWGVLLTLAAFGLGVLINKRTGQAIFNPLLLGTAFVIVVLSVLHIPYDTYAASASPVSYLLLPATVSLAVPLYENGICCVKSGSHCGRCAGRSYGQSVQRAGTGPAAGPEP